MQKIEKENILELNVGDTIKCIKDVRTDITDTILYKKGRIYGCEKNGCLTDIEDDKGHIWPLDSDFYRHFEPLNVRDLGIGFPGAMLRQDKKESKIGQKNDSGKLPYYTVLFKQFPRALKEVIRCSNAGHNKYHETDQDWLNFTRLENTETRYVNAGLRHMSESGPVEDMEEFGGMSHEGAVIWNLMADLEIKLREDE